MGYPAAGPAAGPGADPTAREREGLSLKNDLLARWDFLASTKEQIKEKIPELTVQKLVALQERIAKLAKMWILIRSALPRRSPLLPTKPMPPKSWCDEPATSISSAISNRSRNQWAGALIFFSRNF